MKTGLMAALALGLVAIGAVWLMLPNGDGQPERSTTSDGRKSVNIDIPPSSAPLDERGMRTRDQPDDSARAEIEALKARLARVEGTQQALSGNVAELAGNIGGRVLNSATPNEASTSMLSSEQEEAKSRRELKAQNARIERQIISEPVDKAWAAATESELAQGFSGEGMAGVTVRQTKCRSTLCRVDLSFDTATGLESGMNTIVSRAAQFGEGRAQITDTGKVVLYIAREGYDLPR